MKVMFMFPGQGSQVLRMGLDFYNKYEVARLAFEEVDDALGFGLSKIIFGNDADLLLLTQHTQPALMVVSIAILRSLEYELGKPTKEICDLVAGHSLGEYSALCASGALGLADTADILRLRGQAMADACVKEGGGMIALLGVDIDKAQELCDAVESCLVIANDNASGQVVVSGSVSAIEQALVLASNIGIKKAIRLQVNGAFHSPLMKHAQEILSQKMQDVNLGELSMPLIANVSAKSVINKKEIKDMLVEQVVHQVRWRESLLYAESIGVNKMVEIGSGRVLAGLAKRTVNSVEISSIGTTEDIAGFIL